MILLLFIFIPFYEFSQLAAKSITGKWRGRYLLTSETFPDGIKIKDTIRVHDIVKAEFIFNKNNSGTLVYSGSSNEFYKAVPYIFGYKILPGSKIKFVGKQGKTLSIFHINNDTLYFSPYPVSKALQESIELFYTFKYVRLN